MDQTDSVKPENTDTDAAANPHQKQHVTKSADAANTNAQSQDQGQDQSGKDSEHDGTWLLITSTMGLTLGYVRIDDHDHLLALSEIRGMISSKLADNGEYAHGWQFGMGWPLKVVPHADEHVVLAKDVLPAVSVLSAQSAQHRVMNGIDANASGAVMINTANIQNGHLQPLAMNAMSAIFTPIHQAHAAYYQPSAGVTLLQPHAHAQGLLQAQQSAQSQTQSQAQALKAPENSNQSQLKDEAQGLERLESGKSSLVLLSGNSASSLTQIPSLPPFSPPAMPALSEEQLAAKAKEQRKKLLNLLPRKASVPGSMLQRVDDQRAHAAQWASDRDASANAAAAQLQSAETSSSASAPKKKSARASKPSLPRLKPMDIDGKVIELPPPLAGADGADATDATAFPDAQAQRDLYCPSCAKSFEKERGYRAHMSKAHNIKLARERNKERRFSCARDGCGKSFYQRSDLRRHERVHLGVKPFQCSLCRKQFTQRGSLYRHIKSSHKDQDPRKLVMVQGVAADEEGDDGQAAAMASQGKGRVPRRQIVEGSDVQDLPPPLVAAMPPPLVPLEGKEQAVEGKEEELVEPKA